MQTAFERVRVTWARRAGRITLRRDVRGRWVLTLPAGVDEATGRQYLTGWAPVPPRSFSPTYAAGERHLLLGEYVTLGAGSIPVGESAFEAYRQARLTALAKAQLVDWLPRMRLADVRLEVTPLPGLWGRCRFTEGLVQLDPLCTRLAPDLVEELLLHELTHFHTHDHSPAFWREMTARMPDWAAREGRIRSLDLSPRPMEAP